MSLPKYPLEQLAIIKQKKLDEAEKLLNEKKEALAKEEEKLLKVQQVRDKVKQHKDAKLQQLRDELDQGTTTTIIQQMKRYLKVVDEDLASKDIKVTEQKKQVAHAKAELEDARKNYFLKQKDVEKLKQHRKEWEQEMKKVLIQEEAIVSDELGSAMHILKKMPKKKKKRDH